MRELWKMFLVVTIGAAMIASALAWFSDRPSDATRIWRIAAPCAGVFAMALFLVMECRRETVPDFLRQQFGGYFDRDGFCFVVQVAVKDRRAYFLVFFQNRYEHGCEATVALRPMAGARPKTDVRPVRIDIPCGSAAYGHALHPISPALLGHAGIQEWEVGATVVYPHGKGRRIRFADGAVIRTNAEFRNAWRVVYGMATFLKGPVSWLLHFGSYYGDCVTVEIPRDLSESPPRDHQTQITIDWQLDDRVPFAAR